MSRLTSTRMSGSCPALSALLINRFTRADDFMGMFNIGEVLGNMGNSDFPNRFLK
jgi:hypothetical protein